VERERQAVQKKITTAVVTSKRTAAGTSRAGLGKVIGSILATPYRHYDTATLAELDHAIKRIAVDRPDIFAFTGGDGAVHVIVTRVIREYEARGIPLPIFAYIPIGTMMNIGRSLDLDRMPAIDLAERFALKIEAQRGGAAAPFRVKHIQPIKVNDEYGFIYGSGLPVNFLQEYEKADYRCEDAARCGFVCKWAIAQRHKGACPKCARKLSREALGPWRAIKVIFGSLISRRKRRRLMKPVHAKVTLPDGQDRPVAPFMTHSALMVATVDQLGMGMRGMPEAMSRPNHFMLRSTQMSYWRLALPTTLGALWTGLPLPQTFDAVLPSLVIDYEEPTVATLDGDMLPASDRHVISCGPMLKFITG
jgi:hypothetical protein